MLVITVKPNTYVQVGPDIRIYNTQNHALSIGIDAPRDQKIVRDNSCR